MPRVCLGAGDFKDRALPRRGRRDDSSADLASPAFQCSWGYSVCIGATSPTQRTGEGRPDQLPYFRRRRDAVDGEIPALSAMSFWTGCFLLRVL